MVLLVNAVCRRVWVQGWERVGVTEHSRYNSPFMHVEGVRGCGVWVTVEKPPRRLLSRDSIMYLLSLPLPCMRALLHNTDPFPSNPRGLGANKHMQGHLVSSCFQLASAPCKSMHVTRVVEASHEDTRLERGHLTLAII